MTCSRVDVSRMGPGCKHAVRTRKSAAFPARSSSGELYRLTGALRYVGVVFRGLFTAVALYSAPRFSKHHSQRRKTPMTDTAFQADLIIEPGWIIPIEPSATVLRDHCLAVRDGRIAALFRAKSARSGTARNSSNCRHTCCSQAWSTPTCTARCRYCGATTMT